MDCSIEVPSRLPAQVAGKANAEHGNKGKGKRKEKVDQNTPLGDSVMLSDEGLRLDFVAHNHFFEIGDRIEFIKEVIQADPDTLPSHKGKSKGACSSSHSGSSSRNGRDSLLAVIVVEAVVIVIVVVGSSSSSSSSSCRCCCNVVVA